MSDQGSEFVSHFFQSLGKALDMKLHFTLGYHPEGDGQTKRTKHLSNTSGCTATTSRTIGQTYYLLPSLPTTMPLVLLQVYHCSSWTKNKLSKKNLGPYPIIAQVGTLSFTIHLPNSMCTVHPIFHVSQLKSATLNTILNRSQPVRIGSPQRSY